jgi:hypothetical protein
LWCFTIVRPVLLTEIRARNSIPACESSAEHETRSLEGARGRSIGGLLGSVELPRVAAALQSSPGCESEMLRSKGADGVLGPKRSRVSFQLVAETKL